MDLTGDLLWLRFLWVCSIFAMALIGSCLPFCISRHSASYADRAVAICTAFTGSVCFAVGTFICQEGVDQLKPHWGRIATKIGPSVSILSFITIYCKPLHNEQSNAQLVVP